MKDNQKKRLEILEIVDENVKKHCLPCPTYKEKKYKSLSKVCAECPVGQKLLGYGNALDELVIMRREQKYAARGIAIPIAKDPFVPPRTKKKAE